MENEKYQDAHQDDRVQEILRGLAKGETREALAEHFGYKTYKSLDIYMRRKGFSWDRRDQTYKWAQELEPLPYEPRDRTKAGQVTLLLEQEDNDVRQVAQQLQFADHLEMAQYMKGRGYEWHDDKGNYVKQVGKIEPDLPLDPLEEDYSPPLQEQNDAQPTEKLEQYLPLLALLEKHKERLLDLVVPGGETAKLPRYVLPGVATTKTIQMVTSLKDVVEAYSQENNITQREMFEVALIEFFERYGYQHQVENLLHRR
ncbi:hypothetical protein [Salibacterium qingdaonense]|uniref:Uncharacterized protein n=1 Tax=Salibacterium qingdaonense TaxID=266892 RepID=A0A1I4NK72_9BACI|nr:hypothetical protein [Salibacterium qingdaonense]SFM15908.1 hypothetical protein SAMN04488054_11864 [Salibacterium qingdaonense]